MSDAVFQSLLTRVGEGTPRPRLAPTQQLVDLLGSPHESAPVIHLTGTNGKTSTARMIEALLRGSGLRTGLLTSPHLESFSERIVIDGEPIPEPDLERVWEEVRPLVELVDADLTARGEQPLTFFEALTGLAFACFSDAPVDVVVLEVGIGGEWDSTNVARGAVTVVTPVDLDHVGRIGNTVEEIAQTKSGIIKPEALVVSARQRPSVAEVLRARTAEQQGTLFTSGDQFGVTQRMQAVGGQLITVRGIAGTYEDVWVPMFGEHQAENAAVAIAAVEAFTGGGSVALHPTVVEEAFAGVRSPGRLEVIPGEPPILLDGAHNPHGAAALARALTDAFAFDEVAFVLGMLSDKDSSGLLEALESIPGPRFVTMSTSERAVPADELGKRAGGSRHDIQVISDPNEALTSARAWAAGAPGRAVVVTGSLTLIGMLRSTILSNTGGQR